MNTKRKLDLNGLLSKY